MKSIVTALLICLSFCQPCWAAFDVFIRFAENGHDWIPGDSQFQDYEGNQGWSELRSFDLGIENSVNLGSVSGGGGAGIATFNEINLGKITDSLSADLFAKCALGRDYENVEIVMVRSGGSPMGNPARIMKVSMKLVMVQRVHLNGADGDDHVNENVILQNGAYQIEFFKQNFQTGAEEANGIFIWSRILNRSEFRV